MCTGWRSVNGELLPPQRRAAVERARLAGLAGAVPVAWSSQGRHHCLRGREEPPGLPGPVEGQGGCEDNHKCRQTRIPHSNGGGLPLGALLWRAAQKCTEMVTGWPHGLQDRVATQHRTGRPEALWDVTWQRQQAAAEQTCLGSALTWLLAGPRGVLGSAAVHPVLLLLCADALHPVGQVAALSTRLGAGRGWGRPHPRAPTVSLAGPETSPLPCGGGQCF